MVSDSLAQQLHDKTTRGKTLSAEEKMLLKNWYTFQDNTESMLLNPSNEENRISSLQEQVETALAQLITITRRIEKTASENESLRREIAALRQQLAVTISSSG